MQASSSADETYARLERLTDAGRTLYLRLIVTVDIVFPVAVLAFLMTLARFVLHRTKPQRIARAVLLALPLIYYGFDLLKTYPR